MVIFDIHLPLRENSGGAQKKLNIGVQLQKVFMCHDAIIVLKITLLRSISIITIFVIPKHDKQKIDKKNNTLFRLPMIFTTLGMEIEEARAIFAFI